MKTLILSLILAIICTTARAQTYEDIPIHRATTSGSADYAGALVGSDGTVYHSGDFAAAAQGLLAASALQSGSSSVGGLTISFNGTTFTLSGTPTASGSSAVSGSASVAGSLTGAGNIVTHNASEFASAAQGVLAANALPLAGGTMTGALTLNSVNNTAPNQVGQTPASSTLLVKSQADALYPVLNSSARLTDSFLTECTFPEGAFYLMTTGSGGSSNGATYYGARGSVTASSTSGAIGLFANMAPAPSNGMSFTAFDAYFWLTNVSYWVGVQNTGPLRLSVFCNSSGTLGISPNPSDYYRTDLVLDSSTTAHLENANGSALTTGTEFSVPNAGVYAYAFRIQITGGTSYAYAATPGTSAFPTTPNGSAGGAVTTWLGDGHYCMGAQGLVTGTAPAARYFGLNRMAYRLTR